MPPSIESYQSIAWNFWWTLSQIDTDIFIIDCTMLVAPESSFYLYFVSVRFHSHTEARDSNVKWLLKWILASPDRIKISEFCLEYWLIFVDNFVFLHWRWTESVFTALHVRTILTYTCCLVSIIQLTTHSHHTHAIHSITHISCAVRTHIHRQQTRLRFKSSSNVDIHNELCH